MKVIIALTSINDLHTEGEVEKALFRRVSGIPLLTRVIATAVRAGASKVLLVLPSSIPPAGLRKRFNSRLLSSVEIETAELQRPFDPENPSDWRAIEDRLEPQFLWLPWNLVPDRRFLARLVETASASGQGARFEWPAGSCGVGPRSRWPVVVQKAKLEVEEEPLGTGARVRTLTQFYKNGSLDFVPVPEPPGVSVESKYSAGRVKFIENPVYAETNNMYSLWLAKEWVGRSDFFCLNADVLFHPQILLPAAEAKAPISIILDPAFREETMKAIVREGRVVAMRKGIPREEASGTYLGITRFSRRVCEPLFGAIEELIAKGRVKDFFSGGGGTADRRGNVRLLYHHGRPALDGG